MNSNVFAHNIFIPCRLYNNKVIMWIEKVPWPPLFPHRAVRFRNALLQSNSSFSSLVRVP